MSKLPYIVEFAQTPVVPVIPFNPPVLKFDQIPTSPPVFKNYPVIQFTPNKANSAERVAPLTFELPDFPRDIRAPNTSGYDFNGDFAKDLAVQFDIEQKYQYQTANSIADPIHKGNRIVNIVKYEPLHQMESRDLNVQTEPIEREHSVVQHEQPRITTIKVLNEPQQNSTSAGSSNGAYFAIFDAEMQKELYQMGYYANEHSASVYKQSYEEYTPVLAVQKRYLVLSQGTENAKVITSFQSPEQIANFNWQDAKGVPKRIPTAPQIEVTDGKIEIAPLVRDDNATGQQRVAHRYYISSSEYEVPELNLQIYRIAPNAYEAKQVGVERQEVRFQQQPVLKLYQQEVAFIEQEPIAGEEYNNPLNENVALKQVKLAEFQDFNAVDAMRTTHKNPVSDGIFVAYPKFVPKYREGDIILQVKTDKPHSEYDFKAPELKYFVLYRADVVKESPIHRTIVATDQEASLSVEQLHAQKESVSDEQITYNVIIRPAVNYKTYQIAEPFIDVVNLKSKKYFESMDVPDLPLLSRYTRRAIDSPYLKADWARKVYVVSPTIDYLSELVCDVSRDIKVKKQTNDSESVQSAAIATLVSKRVKSEDSSQLLFDEVLGIPATPKYQANIDKSDYDIEQLNADLIVMQPASERQNDAIEITNMERVPSHAQDSYDTELICDKASLVERRYDSMPASYKVKDAVFEHLNASSAEPEYLNVRRRTKAYDDQVTEPDVHQLELQQGVRWQPYYFDANDAFYSVVAEPLYTIGQNDAKPKRSQVSNIYIENLEPRSSFTKQKMQYYGRNYDFVDLKDLFKRQSIAYSSHDELTVNIVKKTQHFSPEYLNVEIQQVYQEKQQRENDIYAAETLDVQRLTEKRLGDSTTKHEVAQVYRVEKPEPIVYHISDIPDVSELVGKRKTPYPKQEISDGADAVYQLEIEAVYRYNNIQQISSFADDSKIEVLAARNQITKNKNENLEINVLEARIVSSPYFDRENGIHEAYVPFPAVNAVEDSLGNNSDRSALNLSVDVRYQAISNEPAARHVTVNPLKRYRYYDAGQEIPEYGILISRLKPVASHSDSLYFDNIVVGIGNVTRPIPYTLESEVTQDLDPLYIKRTAIIKTPDQQAAVVDSYSSWNSATALIPEVTRTVAPGGYNDFSVSEPLPEHTNIVAHPKRELPQSSTESELQVAVTFPQYDGIREPMPEYQIGQFYARYVAKYPIQEREYRVLGTKTNTTNRFENGDFSVEEAKTARIPKIANEETLEAPEKTAQAVVRRKSSSQPDQYFAHATAIRLSDNVEIVGYGKVYRYFKMLGNAEDGLNQQFDVYLPLKENMSEHSHSSVPELYVGATVYRFELDADYVTENVYQRNVARISDSQDFQQVDAKIYYKYIIPVASRGSSWSSSNYGAVNAQMAPIGYRLTATTQQESSEQYDTLNAMTHYQTKKLEASDSEIALLDTQLTNRTKVDNRYILVDVQTTHQTYNQVPKVHTLAYSISNTVLPQAREINNKRVNYIENFESSSLYSTSTVKTAYSSTDFYNEMVPTLNVLDSADSQQITVLDPELRTYRNPVYKYTAPTAGFYRERNFYQPRELQQQKSSQTERSATAETGTEAYLVEQARKPADPPRNAPKEVVEASEVTITSAKTKYNKYDLLYSEFFPQHQVVYEKNLRVYEIGILTERELQQPQLLTQNTATSVSANSSPQQLQITEAYRTVASKPTDYPPTMHIMREPFEYPTYSLDQITSQTLNKDSFSSFQELDVAPYVMQKVEIFEPRVAGPSNFVFNKVKQQPVKELASPALDYMKSLSEVQIGELAAFKRIVVQKYPAINYITQTPVYGHNTVDSYTATQQAAVSNKATEMPYQITQPPVEIPAEQPTPPENPLCKQWYYIYDHIDQYPFFVTRYQKCGKCLLKEQEVGDKATETSVKQESYVSDSIPQYYDTSMQLSSVQSEKPSAKDADTYMVTPVVYRYVACVVMHNQEDDQHPMLDKSTYPSQQSSLVSTSSIMQPNIIDFVRPKSKLPPRAPEKPLIINEVALVLPANRVPVKYYVPKRVVEADTMSLTSLSSTGSSESSSSYNYTSNESTELESVVSSIPKMMSSPMSSAVSIDHNSADIERHSSSKYLGSLYSDQISAVTTEKSVVYASAHSSAGTVSAQQTTTLSWEELISESNKTQSPQRSSTSVGQVYPKVHKEYLARTERSQSVGEIHPDNAEPSNERYASTSGEVSEGELQYMKAALALGLYE